jgi:hypothetical protein
MSLFIHRQDDPLRSCTAFANPRLQVSLRDDFDSAVFIVKGEPVGLSS